MCAERSATLDALGSPTTRRYARTTREAFPDERAHAVEHYRPTLLERLRHLFNRGLTLR